MPKSPRAQKHSPAKKITREVLRSNPLLAAIFRQRAKEVRELQEAKKAEELPLRGGGKR